MIFHDIIPLNWNTNYRAASDLCTISRLKIIQWPQIPPNLGLNVLDVGNLRKGKNIEVAIEGLAPIRI